MSQLLSIRLRFWLRAMDVAAALGGRLGSRRFRLYLWTLSKAADAEWSRRT